MTDQTAEEMSELNLDDINVDFDEEPLDNPGMKDVKSAMHKISVRKVILSGLGLATPMIVPKMIAKITNTPKLAEGLVGLLIGFMTVIGGTVIVPVLGGKKGDADDFLTGGIAGLGVTAMVMGIEYLQAKIVLPYTQQIASSPAVRQVGAATHQMYQPDTASLGSVLNDMGNLGAELVSPAFSGMERIGGPIY